MPNFPFTPAKPLGWSLFEVFTSAQASKIDANAAQAADGLVWTDVAQLRNWTTPAVVDGTATPGLAYVWSTYEQAWWNFGFASGPIPVAYKLRGGTGGTWLGTGGILAGSGNLTPARNGGDFDPTNNIMMMGGTPTTSTANKFRRYNAATATWTAPASSQVSTGGVLCCKWVAPFNLWVAGHSNGIIETSPDGVTWTNRSTGANSSSRWSMAYGPSSVVVACNVSGSQIMQSTDGINWNIRTLPSTTTWQNVVYVPLLGQFVAFNQDLSQVAFSTDGGATWTARARTLPNGFTPSAYASMNAVAFGRNIATTIYDASGTGQNVIVYSQDGGVTWRAAASFGPTVRGPVASNGSQLWYTHDGNLSTSCIAGGF